MPIDYEKMLNCNIIINGADKLDEATLDYAKKQGLWSRGFDPDQTILEEKISKGHYKYSQLPQHTIAGQALSRVHTARRAFMEKFNKVPDTVYLDNRYITAIGRFPVWGDLYSPYTDVDRLYGMEVVAVLRDDYVAVGLVYTE